MATWTDVYRLQDELNKPFGEDYKNQIRASIERLKAQIKAEGPQMPEFSGDISTGLNADLENINLDTRGLEATRELALGKGATPWQLMQEKKLGADELAARDLASAQSMQGMAQGRAGLAMRGGLTGGAGERMARGGALGLLNAQQNIARTGLTNRLNLGIAGQEQRLKALSGLPGAEVASLEPAFKKAEAKRQAAQFDLEQKRKHDEWVYEQKRLAQEQEEQSSAEYERGRNEKKGSCWLITGLSRHTYIPAQLPGLMTQFKMYCLKRDKRLAKFYVESCGQLVERLDVCNFDWKRFRWFAEAMTSLLKNGELAGAYTLFLSTLAELIETYWPNCDFAEAEQLRIHRNKHIENFKEPIDPNLEESESKLAIPCLQNIAKDRFV